MVAIWATLVVLIFLIGGPISVYCNQTYPELRTSVVLGKDLFVGFFTVAGILLAVENLRRSAMSARVLVSLRLLERWNDPNLETHLWTRWRTLRGELKDKQDIELVNCIANGNRETVLDVLNFMEEIAAAINSKAADDQQIWRAVGTIMMEYFSVLSPWITDCRVKRNQPDLWVEFQTLVNHWKRSHDR
jgi:hypothetical protein